MSRGREGPARFLGQFEGILQTDDYIAYERGIGGPKMVHAACWAHPRRRFVQEKAPPLLDQIREHILTTSKTVLPKSAVDKACSYTLALCQRGSPAAPREVSGCSTVA